MKNIGKRPKPNHPDPEYWQSIREQVIQRDQGCCLCFEQNKDNLVVHHRTYKHFGKETLEDLTTCVTSAIT